MKRKLFNGTPITLCGAMVLTAVILLGTAVGVSSFHGSWGKALAGQIILFFVVMSFLRALSGVESVNHALKYRNEILAKQLLKVEEEYAKILALYSYDQTFQPGEHTDKRHDRIIKLGHVLGVLDKDNNLIPQRSGTQDV